jgi:tripartite-type tricarboxylate transporter receptor subunit TctC
MRSLCSLVLAAGAALVAGHAAAQERPLRLIVPYPPGPGVDLIARTVSTQLSQTLGRQIVVDNRPGAGSVIGVDLAAKSPPDGNTLLFVNLAYAINATMAAKLPYDPLRDLAPVTVVATQPHVLVVHPSVPVKTVRDLIALAKSKPGEVTYASSGNGTGPHLVAEMFSNAAGVRMTHVPYKGANPALTDVVGGHAQIMFATLVSALPHVQGGRLRAVAVTSAKRAPHVPNVPTMIESALPNFEAVGWYMVLVPARTPAPIMARMQAAVAQALTQPSVRERLTGDGAEVVANRPEEAKRFLETEIKRWGAVVKAAGLKSE